MFILDETYGALIILPYTVKCLQLKSLWQKLSAHQAHFRNVSAKPPTKQTKKKIPVFQLIESFARARKWSQSPSRKRDQQPPSLTKQPEKKTLLGKKVLYLFFPTPPHHRGRSPLKVGHRCPSEPAIWSDPKRKNCPGASFLRRTERHAKSARYLLHVSIHERREVRVGGEVTWVLSRFRVSLFISHTLFVAFRSHRGGVVWWCVLLLWWSRRKSLISLHCLHRSRPDACVRWWRYGTWRESASWTMKRTSPYLYVVRNLWFYLLVIRSVTWKNIGINYLYVNYKELDLNLFKYKGLWTSGLCEATYIYY